ncbi:hypothetical protein, partial [Teichococcus deserti]|uniref:hypothetical protein n=1 Tax=Teichococcus deserti TaxID=1817963 RepID=UPI0010567C1F
MASLRRWRLPLILLLLALLAGGGGALWQWRDPWLRACAPLDRLLGRSGCLAFRDLDGFALRAMAAAPEDGLLLVGDTAQGVRAILLGPDLAERRTILLQGRERA